MVGYVTLVGRVRSYRARHQRHSGGRGFEEISPIICEVFDAMTFPDEIDVPRPEDFIKGRFSTIDGKRCCSLGWIKKIFLTTTVEFLTSPLADAWDRAADKASIPRENSISLRSDHPGTTKEQLAAAFEGMLVEVGYEINDS